jgi:hypothetical protein
MPKYTPNRTLIESISGAIGDLVFYRDAEGNLIVQHKGKRTKPPSVPQVAHNDRFKLASAYGNRVKLDPALSAEYRPLCHGRMAPYHAGLRDFLNPPAVGAVDLQSFSGQPGQLIRIVATDDSRVLSVQVLLRHATSNTILEQGPAGLSVVVDQWLYTTTTAIPSGTPILVEATAADRPGNLGVAKVQFFVR